METFRPYSFDKPLFIVTILLLIIGVVMVFSSSAALSNEKFHHPFFFFIQQLGGAMLGILLILFLISLRKPFYQNPYLVYGLLIFTLFLLLLCFLMPPIARTNRWIQFLGFRYQPSELAKISLVLFLAHYLEAKKERIREFTTLLFPLFVLFLFTLLILKEPDYGTAILVFLIGAMLLLLGGVKLKHFLFLGGVASTMFIFYLFRASYRIDRIVAFLWPEKDPLGKSFQVIQSKLAVGSGGPLGVSIGESTQKLFFLPCAHTDFIFAILGEELGLLGTLGTLFLFLVFLWRGLRISFKTSSLFNHLAAAGLTLIITTQAFLNITIVLGLGPPTGIPLPLISFGRSSLITNLLAVGILLNISQRKIKSGIKT